MYPLPPCAGRTAQHVDPLMWLSLLGSTHVAQSHVAQSPRSVSDGSMIRYRRAPRCVTAGPRPWPIVDRGQWMTGRWRGGCAGNKGSLSLGSAWSNGAAGGHSCGTLRRLLWRWGGCEPWLRSTPRYRLVCNWIPAPRIGLPVRSWPGIIQCPGPGLMPFIVIILLIWFY